MHIYNLITWELSFKGLNLDKFNMYAVVVYQYWETKFNVWDTVQVSSGLKWWAGGKEQLDACSRFEAYRQCQIYISYASCDSMEHAMFYT